MKALTLRKPITLTTTAMTSGTFTARLARSQRLHVLRIAGVAAAGWDRVERDVAAGFYLKRGLDVEATTFPDAAAAVTALAGGLADVALLDIETAIRARARGTPVQFLTITGGMDYGYVALAPVIDAKAYAMERFARGLRERTDALFVGALDLQAVIDRQAAEKRIETAFPAEDMVSRVAVMSGVRYAARPSN